MVRKVSYIGIALLRRQWQYPNLLSERVNAVSLMALNWSAFIFNNPSCQNLTTHQISTSCKETT
jgi:hypothetical protein